MSQFYAQPGKRLEQIQACHRLHPNPTPCLASTTTLAPPPLQGISDAGRSSKDSTLTTAVTRLAEALRPRAGCCGWGCPDAGRGGACCSLGGLEAFTVRSSDSGRNTPVPDGKKTPVPARVDRTQTGVKEGVRFSYGNGNSRAGKWKWSRLDVTVHACNS